LRNAIAAVWAVILVAFFIQAGNGLQTDLIGLTAASSFSTAVIGLMLASYYAGFSLAPLVGRAVIGRIGHVTAVAVTAAAAGAVILAMPLLVEATVWSAFRIVSGFAMSLAYVAVESWINDAVPNAVRGRVFSFYMASQFVGMTLAQVLFGMGHAGSYSPFVLSAFLFVMAGLPALLLRKAAPSGVPPKPLGVVQLFRISPAGAAATVLSGLSWSILFMFGPVYARRIGLDVTGVGLFMGLAMAAGGVVQVPAGWYSDTVGRRPVLLTIFGSGLAACVLGLLAHGPLLPFVAMTLVGGFVFPIYAIAAATVNDGVSQHTRVAAASGLVLLFGLGSILGPLLCGWAMTAVGLPGFYGLMAATMAAGIAVMVIWRPHGSTPAADAAVKP
jgi:MFS family permease